jgi:hypothetical protein
MISHFTNKTSHSLENTHFFYQIKQRKSKTPITDASWKVICNDLTEGLFISGGNIMVETSE